jgi:membrane protein DedA with SNARE-associated domain
MEHFAELFQTYGYPMLFLLGIVEFLGLPIAAAPVLMVVGAASIAGVLNPVLAVGSVAMGALLTESFWFGLARWRGGRLLDVACGLASNPNVCVLSFRDRVRKSGAGILIAAKFIPGTGSVPAFAAGLSGLNYRRFVSFDAVALLLWSAAYALVGGIFHAQVETLAESVSTHFAWISGGLSALFVLAFAWRVHKVRLHRGMHARHAGRSSEVAPSSGRARPRPQAVLRDRAWRPQASIPD